jgi:hypothetical protein
MVGMKYNRTLLIIVTLTTAAFASGKSVTQVRQSGPIGPRISITIRTAHDAVIVGSDVEVEVEMKNISQEAVGFEPPSTMSFSTTSFRWGIRDSAGKPVPMTEYGLKANCLDSPGGYPGYVQEAPLAPYWTRASPSHKNWL